MEASDRDASIEGKATAAVEITVTDVAEDTPPAPAGLGVSLRDGGFSIEWDRVTGAGFYEVQLAEGSAGAWEVIATTTATTTAFRPEGGTACGTTYRFRVRAYGAGETHVAGWGTASSEERVTTEACNRAPAFATSTHRFDIIENAATSTLVGTVSATDPDEADTLSYRIVSGEGDGWFAMGTSTGRITMTGALSRGSGAFHPLVVEADDGRGGTTSAEVHISLLLPECSNGTVVPRPADNRVLVRDCSLLLAMRDTLAGDVSLDWSADAAISG